MASGMRGAHLPALRAVLTLLLTLCADAGAQGTPDGFTGFNLNPPYFNLAEGASISATATCGQDERGAHRLDLYCKLVGGASTGVPTENIQVIKKANNQVITGPVLEPGKQASRSIYTVFPSVPASSCYSVVAVVPRRVEMTQFL